MVQAAAPTLHGWAQRCSAPRGASSVVVAVLGRALQNPLPPLVPIGDGHLSVPARGAPFPGPRETHVLHPDAASPLQGSGLTSLVPHLGLGLWSGRGRVPHPPS